MISTARTCNLIYIVLDCLKPITHKKLIEKELEGFGIRLNKKPPAITFRKKDKGGINFTTQVSNPKLDLEGERPSPPPSFFPSFVCLRRQPGFARRAAGTIANNILDQINSAHGLVLTLPTCSGAFLLVQSCAACARLQTPPNDWLTADDQALG